MNTSTHHQTEPERPVSWAPLAVLMTGMFVFVLDFFVVNVALPAIQLDLHASASIVEWVVAGYAVATAALLVTGGRIGDHIGPRAAFGWGLAAFTATSVACALSPTAELLVVARMAQGVAAAVMAPNVLSVLGTVYTGARRAKAISFYGMTMGVAAVSGQLIGGALLGAGLSWRSVFWVNLPVGVIGLLLLRVIPAVPAARVTRFDRLGVLLLGAGLGAVVLPLVDGRQHGWPVWSWVLLAASPFLLGAFALHERRTARSGGSALLDPALLTQPGLAAGLLTQVTFWCQQAASYLFLAIYLQSGRGLSPLDSGLVFTALAVGYLATSVRAPALTESHGRRVLLAGALVAMVGDLLLAFATHEDGSVLLLVPGLVVLGAGQGLCITPLTTTVLGYATPATAGAVSGALSTMQQVGNAIGVGVVGVVFYEGLTHGYDTAFARTTLAMAALLVVVAALTRTLPRPGGVDSPPAGDSTMAACASGSRSATSPG